MPHTQRDAASDGVLGEEIPFQRLREAIMSGELLPNQRLVEAELAIWLGAPRAAIRTAIVRLAQENLVDRLPNRGARVRRISPREAVELLEARMVLEGLAAEHAARNATVADVRSLRALLARMEHQQDGDPSDYGHSNADFHREIVRIARHGSAARLLESLRSRNTIYQFRATVIPNDPRARFEQHRGIVDAIEAREPERAIAAMRAHLSDVAGRLREKLPAE